MNSILDKKLSPSERTHHCLIKIPSNKKYIKTGIDQLLGNLVNAIGKIGHHNNSL